MTYSITLELEEELIKKIKYVAKIYGVNYAELMKLMLAQRTYELQIRLNRRKTNLLDKTA